MASNLLKFPIQTLKTQNPLTPFPPSKTHFPSLPIPIQHHHSHLSFFPQKLLHKSKIPSLSLKDQPTYEPPTSKDEAILQAKTCLTLSLEKPLNNPRLAGKLKKQKQPRYRVEIPVADNSAESLVQLALQLFSNLPIKKKGAPIRILILWPNPTLTKLAIEAFKSTESSPNSVTNSDLSLVTEGDTSTRILSSADVAVFLAPEASQLDIMKAISDGFYPKPVVVFNPMWGFEEESGFGGLSGFVGSFEVIYAFMGLEVRGLLSKRNGVVFRCADGNYSNEGWAILVEEEKGELKVVSRFKKRPSVGEVENVLYNKMAVNSPVTKSVKFLRDLVSNVTGKKDVK
ncbi:uncharacterized protein LOC131237930 [Magnolia sinica]|uniref:uncharacterized protein LOC131237930 n=1 Tax=Magnolia sinica TaxID=86752 RepID=UPI00265A80D1|nr:uncharacterized protein LOC131237930 [Magnolia sinica]